MSEARSVCYDRELGLEAYRFEENTHKFPNHFHDYYVVGFVEKGERRMICRNRTYDIADGDVIVLNPGDAHTCEPSGGNPFDYRCLNVTAAVMENAVFEITGKGGLPHFPFPVLRCMELKNSLCELHTMIMEGERDFIKEELFLLALELMISQSPETGDVSPLPASSDETIAVCEFLDTHYDGPVSLDRLTALCGLSKYQLIRLFAREKGISPYRYLEAVRIGRAREFLEDGKGPLETAYLCGFSDQSHFSRFFKRLIGLTPGQYIGIFDKTDTRGKP